MQSDGLINIATGRSRKEKNWKNTEILWSEFLKKIESTTYTHETYKEYMSADKTRQDEIKDVGGFVGGYINSGRRKAENILNRQLITLDIDFGDISIWDSFLMLYGTAAAIYSTHKHSNETPRLRLIIPLDRPVFADEYQAIARRIAGDLGIDKFDDTTFEPSRLMYWPSTAKNGDYIYQWEDEEWLSADDILGTYFNWQDASSWPESSRVKQVIDRIAKKQGDPTEKPGLIGAFCKIYGIQDCIELFLSDVYEACAIPNRYTYVLGSTSAGAIVYDDLFLYSHHGTDPISGKLCNAFDLVRIHKFGLQDVDANDSTPNNKLPSYLSMLDFISKDSKVRGQIGKEKIQAAKEDFEDTEEEEDSNDVEEDWVSKLDMDRKGNIRNTIDNARIILEHDRNLKDKMRFNDFEKREIIVCNVPWDKSKLHRQMTDWDDAELRGYMERIYDFTTWTKLKDALDSVTHKNTYHPVKDYLGGLEWDGVKRLDNLFIDYLGAYSTPYAKEITRKSLVAAVARIYQPGVKFDYVLTLVGGQGLGKSTILNKLGGGWYSDSFSTVQGKEAIEQIQGVWLIEMGELAGLKKAEVEAVKLFISKRSDRYRVAYGKRVEEFSRQCVFFGTTNNNDFLKDPTGNRRFWPLDCQMQKPTKNVFNLEKEVIDQIWAEAVYQYQAGETLFLSRELEIKANEVQASHSESNEKEGLIEEYLDKDLPSNWYSMNIYDRRNYIHNDDIFEEANKEGSFKRTKVSAAEIWYELFRGELKDLTRRESVQIYNAIRHIEGWSEYDLSVNKGRLKFGVYGSQKAFTKITHI